MEATAPPLPLAPLFTLHQFQKRSIVIVLVVYACVLVIAFYMGTVWIQNSMNQLTLAVQELKAEVHHAKTRLHQE